MDWVLQCVLSSRPAYWVRDLLPAVIRDSIALARLEALEASFHLSGDVGHLFERVNIFGDHPRLRTVEREAWNTTFVVLYEASQNPEGGAGEWARRLDRIRYIRDAKVWESCTIHLLAHAYHDLLSRGKDVRPLERYVPEEATIAVAEAILAYKPHATTWLSYAMHVSTISLTDIEPIARDQIRFFLQEYAGRVRDGGCPWEEAGRLLEHLAKLNREYFLLWGKSLRPQGLAETASQHGLHELVARLSDEGVQHRYFRTVPREEACAIQ